VDRLRSIRFLRNVLTNYMRYFSSWAIGFLLTPIMVHQLGDGDYGLWVTIFSVTGYFGLFDQAIRPSLVRYISRDHARGDREGLSRTMSSALTLYGSVGVVTLIATFFVSRYFGAWFHIAPEQMEDARAVLLIAGASVSLGFLLGTYGAALSGLQRYDIANTIGVAVAIVRALLFWRILAAGGGLQALAWVSLAMNLVGYVASFLAVRRLLPGLPVGRRWVTGQHMKMVGSYSGYAFLSALSALVAFQTDALVITAFLGAAMVTPFALAASLMDNTRALVHSVTLVLAPAASELDARGEKDKLRALLVAGVRYSTLISWPVLFGLLVFGESFLVAWVGEQYRHSAQVLTILAVPTLLALPQVAGAHLLFGVDRHRGVVRLTLLNAALNLVLSLLWVRPFGLVGVAMGTAVPLGLVYGIGMLVYSARSLDIPLRQFMREAMLAPVIASLGFLVPALAVRWLWPPVGWPALIASLAFCSAVYAPCAWRVGVTSHDRARWGRMIPGLFGGAAASRAR
jgi:O-antigen/teichoic acid export membrane protein